jgi:hypothetical protein
MQNVCLNLCFNKTLVASKFSREKRNKVPTGERDFSLLHSVQIGSGAHITSYPMGTVGSFPGG